MLLISQKYVGNMLNMANEKNVQINNNIWCKNVVAHDIYRLTVIKYNLHVNKCDIWLVWEQNNNNIRYF